MTSSGHDPAAGNTLDHGDTGRGPENFDPIENLLGDDPDEAAVHITEPADDDVHPLGSDVEPATELSDH